MNDLLAIPVLAFLASLVLTPVVRQLAERCGIVDKPDAHRKMHERAIPLCGGLAVYLSVLVAVGCAIILPNAWADHLRENQRSMLGLFMSATVLCITGVIDDWKTLSGKKKLIGQTLAVFVLVAMGFNIESIRIFHWQIDLGILSWPFTCLWMLGAVNALNLIDGVDGLATTVGIILCSTLALMASMNGYAVEAILAVAMVGALIGFLYFNFPPATVFLGDAGSMLIGLVAGSLAIRCSLKGPATVALAGPLAVWAIPFFDTAVAILRRKLTGRSIYTTDRGHLHHCLLRRSQTSWHAVSWIAILCMVTSAGALATSYFNNELFAIVATLSVLFTLVASGVFGHAEFLLLASHLRLMVGSLVGGASRSEDGRESSNVRVRLQGSRDWDRIFEQLRSSGEMLGLVCIKLDVNLPMLHESYHASWHRSEKRGEEGVWQTVLPLVLRSRSVGRLEVHGERQTDVSVHTWLGQVAELLESVELQILELAQEVPGADKTPPPVIAAAMALQPANIRPQS